MSRYVYSFIPPEHLIISHPLARIFCETRLPAEQFVRRNLGAGCVVRMKIPDIIPVTDLRQDAAVVFKKIQGSSEPLVVT